MAKYIYLHMARSKAIFSATEIETKIYPPSQRSASIPYTMETFLKP